MSEGIFVVLITTAGSLLGTFSGIMVSSKLTAYRIEQLEEKVNKHNHLVERMTLVENRAAEAHSRIDRMKEKEMEEKMHSQFTRMYWRSLRKQHMRNKKR